MAEQKDRHVHRWSVTDDRIITEMWKRGDEPRQIAKHLKLPTGMVIDRALRLSLAPVRRKSAQPIPRKGLPRPAPISYARLCQWIEGDPVQLVRTGGTIFCGRPARMGSSYCPHHHKICYVPPLPPTVRRPPAF